MGPVVEEFGISTVREIVFRDYRIIYNYDGASVLILTIVHGSHDLKLHHLYGD